jgi:hypothetical protein
MEGLVPASNMSTDRNGSTPSWRIRRRFFAYTIGFASLMMLYVALRWDDLNIARELIAFSTAVWLAVLGFYTTGATLEDINLYGKYRRSEEYDNHGH